MKTATTSAQTSVDSRAVLAEKGDGFVVLAVPGTEYRVRLETTGTVGNEMGKRIEGVVRAQARRIDVVETGGRLIEPLYGRPRRIHGTVVAVDGEANTVAVRVHEQVVFVCKTNGLQQAADFSLGQLVALDVEPGTKLVAR